MGTRRMASWLWAVGVLTILPVPSAAGDVEANLKVVGQSDLGRPGIFGDVAVAGTTAVVATEGPPAATGCVTSAMQVVDIKDPHHPRLAATLGLPPGMAAADIDALNVGTPAFSGDLVAVALTPRPGRDGSCGDGRGARTAFYDVTDPARPMPLGQSAGASTVALAQRRDGKVLAVRGGTPGAGIAIDDVTDPARPVRVGQWADPAPGDGACRTTAGAQLYDNGRAAAVVFSDGRVYDLDLRDPTHPITVGRAERAAGPLSAQAAVLPLGNRTIAIVAEAGPDTTCASDAEASPGLRVLTLVQGLPPTDESPVRYPASGAPGRLVGSGALTYVAWHEAGVRVVDFGEVRARTVAQFVPTQADIVGVALLPEDVVVTDASQGLFVLARPPEGGPRAGFWSQFLSLIPYLGFATVAAAALVVPRLVGGWAMAGSRSRVPGLARVPRRRA